MRRKLLLSLIAIVVVSYGGLIAALVTSTEPTLGLDLQGGISVTRQPVGDYEPEALDLAVERIRERVDSLGVAEPEIVRQGDALVVNLPGDKNQPEAIDLVSVTGQVYLRPVLNCFASPPPTDDSSTTTAPPTETTTETTTATTTPTTSAPTSDTASVPSVGGSGRHVGRSTPPTEPTDAATTT